MANTYLCEKCGDEFTDHGLYKQHKTDHQLGRVGEKKVEDLVGGATPEPAKVESAPVLANPPKPPPWQTQAQDRKRQGIKLEYKFTGYCPTCGGEVETIMLDTVGGRHKCLVLAWCPTCKTKCLETTAHKLPVVKEVVARKYGSGEYASTTSSTPTPPENAAKMETMFGSDVQKEAKGKPHNTPPDTSARSQNKKKNLSATPGSNAKTAVKR